MLPLTIAVILLGQSSTAKQISDAKAMLKAGVAFANHSKKKSSYMSIGPKWVKMKTGKEYLDAQGMWRDDVAKVADVYQRNGHVYVVSMTRSSSSGDWNTFLTCVYREDGSLAICDQMYKAFAPSEGAVETQSIFDAKGKLLKETTKAMDLKEKKVYSGAKAQDLLAAAKPMLFKLQGLKRANRLAF